MSRMTWLADVLRNAGQPVIETNGWRERGYEMGAAVGVMGHHTASRKGSGDMPALGMLMKGRPGLDGPLCNVGLSRSGVWYIVAAGRANHGGSGGYNGVSGNSRWIGIEAENSGVGDEPWPQVQYDNYMIGTAALLRHLGRDHSWFCGHKEYAPGRKIDPWCCDGTGKFNCDDFRGGLWWHLGTPPIPFPTPTPPPTPQPTPPALGKLYWPVLSTATRRAHPSHTSLVQQVTGAQVDGDFYTGARAAVINFQRQHGRAVTGSVDSRTATQIIQYVLRDLGHYGLKIDGLYGPGMTAAVVSFQRWCVSVGANLGVDGSIGNKTTDHLWFFCPK